MRAEELVYTNLKGMLADYEKKGRGESISFLNWFLENIFRLDPVDADDAICDRPNDRGIDGVLVDHTQEEILILQGKIRQKESTIGDAPLRELAGTLTQFDTAESVQALIDGGGNLELKNVLLRNNVKSLIEKGYRVVGVFISNQELDTNGQEFLDQDKNIRVYDRHRIANEFIDIDREGGVEGEFRFDTSYVDPMVIQTGDKATAYILPVQALELVKMDGIEDGTLFSQNVRQSLGNTKVNKALRDGVEDKNEHSNFPLYHNGVNVLCENADFDGDTLTIKNYVVVNGAQSISTFKSSESSLTDDLRVIAKIIELNDSKLVRRITINSNNQNAIKPRDLKSTNEVQLRLREEFKIVEEGRYDLEIKRGQERIEGTVVITNEEAGRLLLAFDLLEPESAHQVYKLFDEKYADIFARPAVNAWRIVLLYHIMERIVESMENINYKPLSKYGLTRFFLLSVMSELTKGDEIAREYTRNPRRVFEEGILEKFCEAVSIVMSSIVVDLNYEVEDLGDRFDYKGDLKSPAKIRDLRSRLLRSFEKDVARKKAPSLAELLG